MRKTLVFIALVCSVAFANAQKISFIYNGRAVEQGDTLTVKATAEQIQDGMLGVNLNVRNNTDNTVSGQKVKCVPVGPNNSLTVASVCLGLCLPGDLSPEFTLAANTTSTDMLIVDFNIPSDMDNIRNIFKLSAGDNAEAYDNSATIYIKAIVGALAIAETAPTTILKAYPNPASGIVTIDYNMPQNGTLVVCNILGEVVKTVSLTAGEGNTRLNVADWPQGIYTYGIQGHAMQKFVVR
ncbi:MAG: T9SS type A sorting domain-containing protein [Bacteroidales bacterium]|nr:T9SS type A sorting domain-containing protein [Bacteroidales bacterium]